LSRAVELAVKYASLVMIPASVAVIVFSRDLVYLTYGRGYVLAPQYLVLLSALYLLTGIGYLILGSFLSGVAETRTVLLMSILTLGLYLPLGLAFTWLWGPYGLLLALFLSNMTSTLFGLRVASYRIDVRLDLATSARILLAALIAALPPIALLLLHLAGPGVVNLIVGGGLYLAAYLTLAPIMRAVSESDLDNLESTLCRTRTVATFLGPVLGYEKRVLSIIGRNHE
jgi:O-antigen/teichoic acid export membrane protein